jgi:hypothetical protein
MVLKASVIRFNRAIRGSTWLSLLTIHRESQKNVAGYAAEPRIS